MTPRRRPAKPSSTGNGGNPVAVLLGDIRAQNKVVIEKVESLELRVVALDRKVDNVRSELLERIAGIVDAHAVVALERRVAVLERHAGI